MADGDGIGSSMDGEFLDGVVEDGKEPEGGGVMSATDLSEGAWGAHHEGFISDSSPESMEVKGESSHRTL